MKISTRSTGIEAARKFLYRSAKILRNETGVLYKAESAAIQRAIIRNADPSYKGSPAKTAALKSAETWEHRGRKHRNKIMSTAYANLRQYCADASRQAILVEMTESDKKEQIEICARELGNP
jgi:hypothetical protein